MRGLAFSLVFIAGVSLAACSASPIQPAAHSKPSVDELLKDGGLPTNFWHKDASWSGKTKDGWNIWIVAGDETPVRAEDGECTAKDFTWVVAVNPKDDHGILYSENSVSHNPEIGFLLNDDPSKQSVPCDHIDSRDYFLLGEGVEPHQAIVLIHELNSAVVCVKQGESQCGRWKKLDMESYKDDFLKLPGLPVFMVEYEDADVRDQVTVKYVLYPPTDKSHEFTFLDCIVRTLPDGSFELDAAEGTPDIVKINE